MVAAGLPSLAFGYKRESVRAVLFCSFYLWRPWFAYLRKRANMQKPHAEYAIFP